MNILLVNHYVGGMRFGMEFRPYHMAREWIAAGHKVRFVAADFSHLRFKNPEPQKDFEISVIDGIEYQWIHTGTYDGNGVKRAITMFEFCTKVYLNAQKIVDEFKPDVVIGSSTYPLDTYPCQRIARLAKIPYIHEGHDLWPLTLTELMGMSKLNPLVILFAIAEKSSYKKSQSIISLLPYAWKHMLEHGMPDKGKFTHIPNGIVMEDWKNPTELPDEHKELMDRLRSENKFVVCYLGGHAPSNALDTVVDAALATDKNEVAYVLVGKGNQKERLIEKASGAANIFFLPPVDKAAVPAMLSMADALYIGAEKCELYRYGVSMNKVYDYMMSGKPIICGVEAANNDVEDENCGITITPESPDAIIEAVDKLRSMSEEELNKLGSNGRNAVMSKYNYKVLSEQFLEVINKSIGVNKNGKK